MTAYGSNGPQIIHITKPGTQLRHITCPRGWRTVCAELAAFASPVSCGYGVIGWLMPPPVRVRVPYRAFTSFAYSMNRIKGHELLMNMHEATSPLHCGVCSLAKKGSTFQPALTAKCSTDANLTCDPFVERQTKSNFNQKLQMGAGGEATQTCCGGKIRRGSRAMK